MPTPQGHIRKRGSSYEIAVPVGRDSVTGRYRYAYDKAATLEAAKRLRDEMLERIADGRDPATRATVGELLDRWLALAELEMTTRVTYEGYIERVIRPVLGDMKLRHLERHVEILDDMYAGLRKCRRLCGGQRDLIDHRPAGQASKAAKARGGEVAHHCDARCRPHACRPLEPATILQMHSILRRAFRYAVKWRWIRDNPAQLATVPRARQRVIEPPSPAEAMKLLKAAEEHSADLALFVWP